MLKINPAKKVFLAAVLAMVFQGCTYNRYVDQSGGNGGTDDDGGGSPAVTTVKKPVVETLFDTDTVGWEKNGERAIIFKVTADSSNASFECRFAHIADIGLAAYSECTPDTDHLLKFPQPTAGTKNGTFKFQVRVKEGSDVSDAVSASFYVHDSLNTASACALPQSDSYYINTAAPFLDQSLEFDSATNLANPFVQVALPRAYARNYTFADGTLTDEYTRANNARIFEIRSLRKRFKLNDARTLLFVSRKYDQRFNASNCKLKLANIAIDANGDNHFLDLAAGELPVPSSDPKFKVSLDKREINCDAIVLNALGKGVCFSGSSLYFNAKIAKSFKMVQKIAGSRSTMRSAFASNKHAEPERDDYEAMIADVVSGGQSEALARLRFVFLED